MPENPASGLPERAGPRCGRVSPASLAILLLMGAGAVIWLSARARGDRAAGGVGEAAGTAAGHPESAACEPGWGCEAAGPGMFTRRQESAALRAAPLAVRLPAREVCTGAGYLCRELEDRDSLRVLRWPEEAFPLRVRVPLPPVEPASLARRLRAAAVSGLLAWSGHPSELIITEGEGTGQPPAHIVVEWVENLGGQILGQAHYAWEMRAGKIEFQVTSFRLSLKGAGGSGRPPTPQEIELTAAHEMGHALGLPHSDSPGDVMFPRNTATRLSVRDYRTVEALYRLPNGALIVRQ